MSVLERKRLSCVRWKSSANSCSSSSSTLLRSGVAACSRWRVMRRPKRSMSRRRLTRAEFSKPLRSESLSPRPMRVDASMNFVIPPGETTMPGCTGRPKNMSSFE